MESSREAWAGEMLDISTSLLKESGKTFPDAKAPGLNEGFQTEDITTHTNPPSPDHRQDDFDDRAAVILSEAPFRTFQGCQEFPTGVAVLGREGAVTSSLRR